VLLIALAAPAGAADARGDTDWFAEPVPSSSLTDGGWYRLAMEPGTRVEQAVSVRNTAAAPVELRLAGVDAVTGARGGVSYGPADQAPVTVGTWIELSRDSVVLQPGATEVVPFTVAVPADAPPGTSLGGIAIWAPADARTSAADPSAGGAAALVSVQTRRVIAVEVALPGPDDPELVIGGVRASARPDGLYLEVDVRNEGHGLTKATGALRVPAAAFSRDLTVDTFVPGTAIAYPVKWEGDGDPQGRDVTVELRYGDRVATWSGTVDVQDAVREELSDRQVEQAPGAGGLPVPALLALGAVGGLGLAAIASRVLPRLRARPRGDPRAARGTG
jgi:hypothetical protein